MTIRIDRATPADVPTVLALIRELAEFEHLLHEVEATEAQLHDALFGYRPSAEVVMARLEQDVVGFALFFQTFSTFLGKPGLYLEDLYIRQAYRGRGYGAALLRHLARTALERGCGRFEWAVLDWNQNAIDFYTRLGARAQDQWTVYRVTGKALTGLGNENPGLGDA